MERGITVRYDKILFFLCLWCVIGGALQANPFTGTRNSPAPVRSEKPSDFLVERQAQLHTQLGEYIYEWTQTNSMQTFWAIIGISFVYGFMHALGPGHRKTLVFSFYLSKSAPLWEPALTSIILAGLHGITSIVLLVIFRNVAGAVSVHTASASIYLEGFSYLLLLVLSIFSILHVLSHIFPKHFAHFHFGCGCNTGVSDHMHDKHEHSECCGCSHTGEAAAVHGHHHAINSCCGEHIDGGEVFTVQKVQWGAFLLSGIYPCPAALLVLVLVSTLDAAGLGILAVMSMSAGMAVPITVIAYLAWAGRIKLFNRMQKTQRYVRTVSLVLGLAAYVSIFLFSCVAVLPFIKSLLMQR